MSRNKTFKLLKIKWKFGYKELLFTANHEFLSFCYFWIMITTPVFIFEHIPILKSLPHFRAHVAFLEHILVLRQLLEFTSISIFRHLRNKTRFLIKYKKYRKQTHILFFYHLKIIMALRNQNINIILFLQYRFN